MGTTSCPKSPGGTTTSHSVARASRSSGCRVLASYSPRRPGFPGRSALPCWPDRWSLSFMVISVPAGSPIGQAHQSLRLALLPAPQPYEPGSGPYPAGYALHGARAQRMNPQVTWGFMRYVNAAPGEQPRDGLLPLVEGDDDFAVGRVVGRGHAVGDRRAGGRAGVAGTAAAAAEPGNVLAAIVRGRAAAAAAVVAAPAGPAAGAGQAGGDIVSADAERAGRTRPALGNCAGRAG